METAVSAPGHRTCRRRAIQRCTPSLSSDFLISYLMLSADVRTPRDFMAPTRATEHTAAAKPRNPTLAPPFPTAMVLVLQLRGAGPAEWPWSCWLYSFAPGGRSVSVCSDSSLSTRGTLADHGQHVYQPGHRFPRTSDGGSGSRWSPARPPGMRPARADDRGWGGRIVPHLRLPDGEMGDLQQPDGFAALGAGPAPALAIDLMGSTKGSDAASRS
jgi:hypothetical protein